VFRNACKKRPVIICYHSTITYPSAPADPALLVVVELYSAGGGVIDEIVEIGAHY